MNNNTTCRLGTLFAVLCTCLLSLSLQGCHSLPAQAAPPTAAETLKQSMATYAKITTFHADCNWSASYGAMAAGPGTSRAIWYKKPNVFKVVSKMAGGFMVQTSVSDGSKLVEYATGVGTPAQSYSSPPSIADVSTMQMSHPMFCGSLLYKFFGGPAKYAELVDESKQPVTFGAPVTLDGQACKTVKFYAKGQTYGRVELAIGTADGLVHRIQYDSEPLMKMMQSGETHAALQSALKSPDVQKQLGSSGGADGASGLKDALGSLKNIMPTSSITTETYLHIAVGKPIEAAVFNTKPPKDLAVQDMPGGSTPQPPVALGSAAPAVHVVSMDGSKHSLADFKGQIVLIDFWATWCPPCRKGLPETQKFYSDYGAKGLTVLTISDEPKATVQPFLTENKYTFPAYLDTDGATNKAYKIEAIPTVAVIDRTGNLVAYMVGLSPREDIAAALKKAGLDVK